MSANRIEDGDGGWVDQASMSPESAAERAGDLPEMFQTRRRGADATYRQPSPIHQGHH